MLLFVNFLLTLFTCAFGHGYVHKVTVGGQTYDGWNPFSDAYVNGPPKVVRKVVNDGFVASSDVDIACHHGGNEGTLATASAPSGSKIVFDWTYWPGDHQGPVSTYMASCNGDCSKFGANNAQWFKIDAEGYDSSSRQWAAAKLISNGASWTSTIPANLEPGEYLVRNEIIALHSTGTPQFYPSCSQITVTGSGTGKPSDNDLVSMQALYSGVTFPNIYTDSNIAFTMPGPPPVKFDGSGITTTTTTSSRAMTSTAIAASTTTISSSYPSRPSMQCHLGSKLRRRQSVV